MEGDPDLTAIIPFKRERWRSVWHWPEAWRSLRGIRELAFDWVIDLQSLMRSGIVAWLANGALTIGLDDAREGARGFYDVMVPRRSPSTHAVDWYLSVLTTLGVPIHWKFKWLPEHPTVAAGVREKWFSGASRWIILQPGARWENKRWPVEHFRELVRLLTKWNPELRFAVLGSRNDAGLGQSIARTYPGRCLDLTGRLSLIEMVECIRAADLMITNDTGPMHVAAALNKPVVAIFGPTDPRRTGPYRQIEQAVQLALPCVPCLKSSCAYTRPLECLRALSPDRIFVEVQRRLVDGKA